MKLLILYLVAIKVSVRTRTTEFDKSNLKNEEVTESRNQYRSNFETSLRNSKVPQENQDYYYYYHSESGSQDSDGTVRYSHSASSGNHSSETTNHKEYDTNGTNTNRDECGQSDIKPRKRIVNGKEVVPHSIPWQAGLKCKFQNCSTPKFLCGGSVLTHHHILTAAHCEKDLSLGNVVAVFGQHDQNLDQHAVEYEVECIIPHPKYKHDTYSYDFALYITKDSIQYSKYVQPVCLPHAKIDYGQFRLKVSGWGKLSGSDSEGSNKLQAAEITQVPHDECKKVYSFLTDHMFCAMGHKDDNKTVIDSCAGDSGGPLTIEKNNVTILVGVVMFGAPDCNNVKEPGVYAKVHYFLDWLREHGIYDMNEKPTCPGEPSSSSTSYSTSSVTTTESALPPASSTVSYSSTSGSTSSISSSSPDQGSTPGDDNPEDEQCGISEVKPQKRIVNGKEVVPNSIPWQVGLKNKKTKIIFCGGSIITSYHILTAAQCRTYVSIKNVVVVVGQHQQDKFQNEIDYEVQCIIVHPNHKKGSYNYDIALYITKTPIKYSKYASPVCLPKTPMKYGGNEMKVSGWGKLNGKKLNKKAGSATLQAAHVKGIDWDKCMKVYPELEKHMLCAIGIREDNKTVVDSCDGDNGGPLTIEKESVTTVVGIMSWGSNNCHNVESPRVYTKIDQFLNWLDKHGVNKKNQRPKCPSKSKTTKANSSAVTKSEIIQQIKNILRLFTWGIPLNEGHPKERTFYDFYVGLNSKDFKKQDIKTRRTFNLVAGTPKGKGVVFELVFYDMSKSDKDTSLPNFLLHDLPPHNPNLPKSTKKVVRPRLKRIGKELLGNLALYYNLPYKKVGQKGSRFYSIKIGLAFNGMNRRKQQFYNWIEKRQKKSGIVMAYHFYHRVVGKKKVMNE